MEKGKYFYFAHTTYSLKNGNEWSVIPILKNQCYSTNDKYTAYYAGNDIKDSFGEVEHFITLADIFRTRAEAENFAKMNKMVYWETSAKEGNNVEEVFTYIGKLLFETYKDENALVGNSLFMNKDNTQSSSNFTNILHITDRKKCC